MEKEKLIPVCVYADTTGLYTDEECDFDNLCYIDFPENIVLDWFIQGQINGRIDRELGFVKWYNDEYTADDTDGLYQFAEAFGFHGKRLDQPATEH